MPPEVRSSSSSLFVLRFEKKKTLPRPILGRSAGNKKNMARKKQQKKGTSVEMCNRFCFSLLHTWEHRNKVGGGNESERPTQLIYSLSPVKRIDVSNVSSKVDDFFFISVLSEFTSLR